MKLEGQFDALDRLGAAFDEAADEGYLLEKPQKRDARAIHARRRVVGVYLFLLGYLDRRPVAESKAEEFGRGYRDRRLDHAITKALRLFQRDAGLVEDGWPGPETWGAIQELASFEHPTNVARWYEGDEPRPVLRRAAYLRLFAFGLTKLPPLTETCQKSKIKQRANDFQQGLDGFVRAVRLLRLTEGELAPALVPSTLGVMFDQDRLCERASDFLKNPEGFPKQEEDRRRAMAFLQNAARIELWLYGYNLRVGNHKNKGPFVRPDAAHESFDEALSGFCTDHGQEKKFSARPSRDALQVLTWFFSRLVVLYRGSPEIERTEDADEVVDTVLKDRKLGKDVQRTVESLGARLWDGVKRVWNWIKSAFKTSFDSVKTIAKRITTNISRYIHEAALKVYSHVVAAVRAVSNGIDFLKEEIILGSDSRHMVVMHDRDLDFDIFVNAAADPVRVENLSERIVLRSEILAVGARIISSLTSFFLSAIRYGLTTSWFALMLALAKLYKTIKHLREFSKRALDLITQLDELRAQA